MLRRPKITRHRPSSFLLLPSKGFPPPPLVLPLRLLSFSFIALYSKAPLLIPSKAQTKNLSRCHLPRRAIYHRGCLAASPHQRGGAGTGGRVKDFHAQQKTCHNYLWLLLGHIIGHIKLLFFFFSRDERPHIAGSLVEVGHRHLSPYTYNFQDNGGALGEVTVTNTGAPTESWAGCYMSDCANNHAESSRVWRRAAGGVVGETGEPVGGRVCVSETGRSWGSGRPVQRSG